MPPMYLRCSLPGIAWAMALLRGRMKTICRWQQELYCRHACQVELESTSQAAVKTGMTNVAGPSIPGSTGGHAAGASAAYENEAWVSVKALSILILRPGVGGEGEGYSGSHVTGMTEWGKTTKKVQKTLVRILNRHYKDLWSMMQLWCINVSKVCHLATYLINFQVELLSMIDIQDIFNIPSYRINAGQRAFYYLGVKIWNNLSNALGEIRNNTKVF